MYFVSQSSAQGFLGLRSQAGEPGFEPGLTGSEPVVLPLHHSPEFVHNKAVSCIKNLKFFS